MSVPTSRAAVKQACLHHMVARINAVKLTEAPYPHFSQNSFFPGEVYDRLLRTLPQTDQYDGSEEYSSATSKVKPNRFTFSLLQPQLAKLKPDAREFLLGVRDAVGSPLLKRAVFAKLSPGLAYRYGIAPEEAADVEGYPNPMLFRETAGYSIKPHPDTRRKIVTFQVALSRDESQHDLGTSMYKLSLNPKHLLEEPRGFQRVGRYPFLPNTVFAFSVINTMRVKSWHGRETLRADCGERNSLLLVYYGKAEDGNAEVVAEQYADQRHAA